MANPDRDVYSNDGTSNRTVYKRESSSTGWFVGIIVALALLAIGYLVFSANTGPTTDTTTINNTPAVEAPATDPMVEAPAAGGETAPMTEAPPADDAAPAVDATEPPPPSEAAPAVDAPVTTAPDA